MYDYITFPVPFKTCLQSTNIKHLLCVFNAEKYSDAALTYGLNGVGSLQRAEVGIVFSIDQAVDLKELYCITAT